MWAAYFWMGACKQDDVVVVIKIGALVVVLVLYGAYSETYHVLLSLFAPHQTLSPRTTIINMYCVPPSLPLLSSVAFNCPGTILGLSGLSWDALV